MIDVQLRAYKDVDRTTMLKIMDANIPNFFDPSERLLFEGYLLDLGKTYLVAELSGEGIVAGGGLYVNPKEETATFCWGMVAPAWHRKGIGTVLSQYRVEAAQLVPGVRKVISDTSQYSWEFYEKMGFKLINTEKDHWGPGLDLYAMVLDF